ncbi:MAG TPA: cation-transporting P-type ATPase, partial [Clostridiales bacterium]|nr:cation-transporting P-type ATPase [Clostridiales bacterium]
MNFINRKNHGRQIQKNKLETENKIRSYAFLTVEELFAHLSSAHAGLTSLDAENRQNEFGKNVITIGNKNTTLHRLKEAIVNPFNIILLIVAVVTYFTDVVASKKPDYLTVSIILSLVFLSGLVAFVQNQRSNAAAEKLSKMISNKSSVRRDGKLIEIPMDEIVPGDVVWLSAGDMLPGDVRFLITKDTFVAQAALTGESNPVEKFSDARNKQDDTLTDLCNIGFMGSNIVSGSATAIILTTGNNTYFGSMAKTLSGDRAETSFERGVNS